MTLELTPMTGEIGAEIRGLDVGKPLDASVVAEIRQALLDHLVLVFREQDLDEE